MAESGAPVAPDKTFVKIDLTETAPLAAEPRSDKEVLGVSAAVDEFFLPRKKESEKDFFSRQEIWTCCLLIFAWTYDHLI